MNVLMSDNFNYIEYLIKQYVRFSQSPDFSLQERQDLQHQILIELFFRYGFLYSSDGKCSIF